MPSTSTKKGVFPVSSHCISVRQKRLKCLNGSSISFDVIINITNYNKLVLHNALQRNFTHRDLHGQYSIW